MNLADGFEGLNGASVETLWQIYQGLENVSNGIVTSDEVMQSMVERFGGLTDEASNFYQKMSEGADYAGYYESAIKDASETTQQFGEEVVKAGENIASGIAKGFENADVETPVAAFFGSTIAALASTFDMHSPAKKMEPYGENIFLGIVEGFKAMFSTFSDVVSEWWESYVVPLFSAERWMELGETVKVVLTETWTSIFETIIEVWTGIQEWFIEYWTIFTELLMETWTGIQEWFNEYWTVFTDFLTETWNKIVQFFTDTWARIQLLFQNFIQYLTTIFITTWQVIWQTAQNIFQTFHDFVNAIANLVKELLTRLADAVTLLVTGKWKGAWENAQNIFNAFKNKVEEIINVVKGIIQEFFEWVMGIVSEIISAIESIGEAVSNIFGGGGGSSSGGGGTAFSARSAAPAMASYSAWDFAPYVNDLPHLASGSVLRGGDPFMAILNEQPRGQTNIEAPLDTIKQAVREELSGMNFGGNASLTVPLYLDGEEFARIFLDDILSEMDRQGYDVDILGVT